MYIISELIKDYIPSVKSSDTAGMALEWMNEFKLAQLPVVDDGLYKGLITEDNILEAPSLAAQIKDIQYHGYETAYLHAGKHIYDAIQVMSTMSLEILPILDEDNTYLGVVTLKDLMTGLGNIFAIHEPGGLIVLEIPQKGYALSEIARIAESENAKILSLYMSRAPQGHYLLTLKLNIEDLSRVVASFERFEYKVVKTYYNIQQIDDYQRNIDALMNYLDI
ncbi:MAG: CBS domain-containing protein [Bacteroidetes bacterium]|nr:MAG: CBS domain-containing protein [Bacteroidota bacterium]